jgi:hypothetical protein
VVKVENINARYALVALLRVGVDEVWVEASDPAWDVRVKV